MAWNIQQGGGASRGPSVCSATSALSPDLVIFSEWSPRGHDFQRELAAGGWIHSENVHSSTTAAKVIQKAWGLLALSKVEITRREVLAPPEAPASWLELLLPEYDVVVVGVRVLSPVRGSAFRARTYWEWVHEQAERLAGEQAVLMGDFNVPSSAVGGRGDPGVGTLMSHGWRDVVAELSGDTPSFFNRSGAQAIRNDFAFVSPGFAGAIGAATHPLKVKGVVLSGPKGSSRVSDHAPLVVDIDP